MSGKKSKVPVQLDIGIMLAALEKKQQSQKTKQDTKPVVHSGGLQRLPVFSLIMAILDTNNSRFWLSLKKRALRSRSVSSKNNGELCAVAAGLPVVQKQHLVQKKPPWQQDKVAHNPLDSTSPLVKKGKQREVPKAKKPTPLKKVRLLLSPKRKVFHRCSSVSSFLSDAQVILKEREERKQRRLLEEMGLLPDLELQPTGDPAEEDQSVTDPSGEARRTKPNGLLLRVTATLEVVLDSSACHSSEAADVGGNSVEETNDETKLNAAGEEEEEEADREKVTQQLAVASVPCPAGPPKIHSRKFRE